MYLYTLIQTLDAGAQKDSEYDSYSRSSHRISYIFIFIGNYDDNASEGFFPSLKTAEKAKNVPVNVTASDLIRANDKLTEEIQNLIVSMEDHLQKARDSKRQILEQKKYTEGLHDKDDGNLCLFILRSCNCRAESRPFKEKY